GDLAALAGSRQLTADEAARATSLAQRILRIDPSAGALSDVAARLAEAGTAIAAGRNDEGRAALDRAATDLAAAVRAELGDAPAAPARPELRQLDGLLADALKRGKK